MDFIIPANITGAGFSLLVKKGGKYKKCSPKEKLKNITINIEDDEFAERVKLRGLKMPSFPPERFSKPYKQLIGRRIDVPWIKCIPKNLYDAALKEYISLIEDILLADFPYYNNYFLPVKKLFDGLEAACIDYKRYNKFLCSDSAISGKAILKSFCPKQNNEKATKQFFSSPIKYSRISSKTGRLTIASGPSILHLKKEYRSIIISKYKNGSIFYLDYKSLEPRALLAIKDSSAQLPKDIYEHALKSLDLQGTIDRQHIKTALISTINGAGDREVARQLSGKIDYPEDFIKIIKAHFGIDELREKLSDEYEKHKGKLIYNYFGRPVLCEKAAPYVLLNYFIQSTAVDIAMLGFNAIYTKLISSGGIEFCKPIFILHDALILDVAPELTHLIEKIAITGTVIPKFENTKFWIDSSRNTDA